MINALIQTAIEGNVPFSFLVGHLEAGGNAKKGQQWQMMKTNATWRPLGFAEFILGRLVPPAPLPTFDQEEIQSGSSKTAFKQMQHHRLCLRVPQPNEDDALYANFREVALQALDEFDHLENQGRLVRMLSVPSSYMAAGGGIVHNNTMTTQHFPLVIEDAQTHEVLWVHPEASSLMNGGRIGGGVSTSEPHHQAPLASAPKPTPVQNAPALASSVTPQPEATPPLPKPVAPVAATAPIKREIPWLEELKQRVTDLGVPESNALPAMIRLRARDLTAAQSVNTEEEALAQAENEISKALAASTPLTSIPEWFLTLQAEAADLGVPEPRHLDYCLAQRAKQLQTSEAGLSLEEAKIRVVKELEAIRTLEESTASNAQATPEWLLALQAEATELGVPEPKHLDYCLAQRAKQVQASEAGLSLDEAKARVAKELESTHFLQGSATVSTPATVERISKKPRKSKKIQSPEVAPESVEGADGTSSIPVTTEPVSKKPRKSKKTQNPEVAPEAVEGEEGHPTDIKVHPKAILSPELAALKTHIEAKRITITAVSKLIKRDFSVTSRYFSGDRGHLGLDPEVLAQMGKINDAITHEQPLPEPLDKPVPRKKGRSTGGPLASAGIPSEEV